ncbi:hypothetical protein FA13DRAFT_1747593 [Coprinellus micaceus]|uniref:Calcineurin-like phosphoesterase domain-containing protein n=1 Tax=Coprinellus micaceus TaxID=71717 RepID=A0A4Y7S3V4_COPMI|nr:hypothetical protein FA13DRAFT_1747593 [Coprinellus micaceus]
MDMRVHKDHTSANDVPHPGQGWTRFVCISDTHSHFPEIPLGDVLFHAGDMSSWGYPAQIQQLCLDPDLHGVFEEGDEVSRSIP